MQKDPFGELDLDALRQQAKRWLKGAEEMFGCRATAIAEVTLYALEPTETDPCRYEIRTRSRQPGPSMEKVDGEWEKSKAIPSVPAGDIAFNAEEIEGVYREKPEDSPFLGKWWRLTLLRPGISLPSRDGSPFVILYEKGDALEGLNFPAMIGEADLCYDVFKKLKKIESLSDESWAEGVKRLGLKIIVPGDIAGISLHQGPKDQKRNIVCGIVQSALKRLYPGENYTIEDLDNIRTDKSPNRN